MINALSLDLIEKLFYEIQVILYHSIALGLLYKFCFECKMIRVSIPPEFPPENAELRAIFGYSRDFEGHLRTNAWSD
jgi:hypothetical protein